MQLQQRARTGRAPSAQRSARPARVQRLRLQAAATIDTPVAKAGGAQLTEQVVADEAKYILQTYGRPSLVFVKGEGCKMWDANGKEYLDMAAGACAGARIARHAGAAVLVPAGCAFHAFLSRRWVQRDASRRGRTIHCSWLLL